MSISNELLKKNLLNVFNLNSFVNNEQKQAVEVILKREQDVLISMPSGSRKSLCFQLPGVLQENKTTIVLSPLMSSIKDQIHYLRKSKICAKLFTSTISSNERERITKDLTSERPEIQFLYVTPDQVPTETFGRILQSLYENEKLAYFAVDEAHCASQRVQDFREDYIKFGSCRASYPLVPWILLTHNASTDVSNEIVENLQLRTPVATFKTSSFRKNLYYDIIFKNTILDQFTHLKKYVISCLESDDDVNAGNDTNKPCGIIYCKDRDTVDLVAKKLIEQGVYTKAHHGGLRSKDRKKIQADWKAGSIPIITSTTSFVAGIERASVRFVVHWDVSRSVASYYKESGMAGRDGQLSYCRIYYSEADVMAIDAALKDDISKAKDDCYRIHADFLKMCAVCEMVTCRHKMFSDYFQEDIESDCQDKCDFCKNPNEADVALKLFRTLGSASTRVPTSLIELENHAIEPMSGATIIKTEVDCPRNVNSEPTVNGRSSPANTIIKEEESHLDTSVVRNGMENLNLSHERFEMQTEPVPGNVSPARTIVKDELDLENATNDLGAPRSASPAETVIEEKPDVNTFRSGNDLGSPRCVSPAETVIEEKPAMNAFRSGDVTMSPQVINPSAIKNELKSPVQPTDENETIRHRAPVTPTITQPKNTSTDPITPTAASIGASPTPTVIKQEQPTVQSANRNSKIFNQESRRSLSPTGTIIKDECLSPERQNENDLENLSDGPLDYDVTKKFNRELMPTTETTQADSKPTTSNSLNHPSVHSDRQRDQSTESERGSVLHGTVNFKEEARHISSKHSSSKRKNSLRQRNTSERYDRASRRRSRSRSNERFKRGDDRCSRSYERFKRDDGRRSRSNERLIDRYHDRTREPRSSSSRKRPSGTDSRRSPDCRRKRRRRTSDDRIKSKRESRHRRDRMQRYSSESNESDVEKMRSNDRYCSPQPSTSANARKNVGHKYSDMRFSVSPEKIEIKEDYMDSDYGWEDPAPPKLKTEAQPKSTFETGMVEKMREFEGQLHSGYDFEAIEARKKTLMQYIEDSITLASKKKLTELDRQIQKKSDDYVVQLFGRDNFDSWDDDPALSNVEVTAKLKPFKSHVPDDIPLIEKMSMKHVINVMKLTPARHGNELVFHGHIKEIENEFQGRPLPPYLLESLKREKSIIADLVKKFLMPYHTSGRIRLEFFNGVARKISHFFYEHFANEHIIKKHIDDLFKKYGQIDGTNYLKL